MERKPNCTCVVCRKRIYRRPSQLISGSVYCSSTCCGVHQRQAHLCSVCGIEYFGPKLTCSRACANKTREGSHYTRENTRNKAYLGSVLKETLAKARGGICEHCTEDNYAILQVHHKIERARGGSDALNNLELLCPNCHFTHHLGYCLFKNKKNDRVLPQSKWLRRKDGGVGLSHLSWKQESGKPDREFESLSFRNTIKPCICAVLYYIMSEIRKPEMRRLAPEEASRRGRRKFLKVIYLWPNLASSAKIGKFRVLSKFFSFSTRELSVWLKCWR